MEIYAILAQSDKGGVELMYISTFSNIELEYKNYCGTNYEYYLIKTELNQLHEDGIINEPIPEKGKLELLPPIDSKVYVVQYFAIYEGSYISEPSFLTTDRDAAINHAKNIKNTLPSEVIPYQVVVYAIPLDCNYTLSEGIQKHEFIHGFKKI